MFGLFRKPRSGTDRGSLEIRLEAIGGQGAHSAGKLLAEAFVMAQNWSGHHFSSFGSEKRGTPVTSHVRVYKDRRPVRSASPVQTPDALVIFHELLLSHHRDAWSGVGPTTDVLVHSQTKPSSLRLPKEFECRNLATIPAMEIALATRSHVNAPLLGALTALLPELKAKTLRATFESFFARLKPEEIANNLRGFDQGIKQVQVKHFRDAQAREVLEVIDQPDLGWFTAPIGGAIINPGNSAMKDLSASRRGTMPLLNPEICINCGYCDMVCPDFCFVWGVGVDTGKKEPALQGIDYHYCKGCQKCVTVCPVGALSATKNDPVLAAQRRVPRFPQIKQRVPDSLVWWQGPLGFEASGKEMLSPQKFEESTASWTPKKENS